MVLIYNNNLTISHYLSHSWLSFLLFI